MEPANTQLDKDKPGIAESEKWFRKPKLMPAQDPFQEHLIVMSRNV